jgi:penicillin-binding protein 2
MNSPLSKGASQPAGCAPAQNQVIALRVAIIGAVLLGLFAIVLFRLWYLQVLSGHTLAAQATQNRVRNTPVTPPRGNIVDRKGGIIVQNKRAAVIEMAPASLPEIERTKALEFGQKLGQWYALTAAKRKTTPRPAIVPLSDPSWVQTYGKYDELGQLKDLQARYARLGSLLKLPAETVRRRVINSYYLQPYAYAPLTQDAQPAEVAYVAENASLFPGVSAGQRYVRSYPLRTIGAQLLGQVGPVPVDDKTHKTSIDKYKKLNTATQVGLSGLEFQYNGDLSGQPGSVRAHIDAQGDVVGTPTQIDPIPGNTLQLTLDNTLQAVAQKAISGAGGFNPGDNPAAAIAMDPRDGSILASVSNPTYNPNVFANISKSAFRALVDPNGSKPLFNRVLAGAYPAGSTFKPVTTLAALASKVTTPTEQINDPGFIKISDTTYTNAKREANGPIALERAIQVSSDVYFYTMGERLNGQAKLPLQQWAERLGYGHRTGIDLPGERAGTVPDPKWRIALNKLEKPCRIKRHIQLTPGTFGCGYSDMRTWSVGDEVGLSVGQGDVQVTPLQSAVMYAAIENGGKIVTPHLGAAIQNRAGETVQTLSSPAKKQLNLDPTALSTLRAGLFDAANAEGGTSQKVFADWPKKYAVYGKTGTAERGAGRADQAWYAAYVPDAKRPIVVVVTVENGGFGATTAAPIAAQIMRAWYHLSGTKISAGDSSTY